MKKRAALCLCLLGAWMLGPGAAESNAEKLEKDAANSPLRLVCEGYKNNNWDLFVIDASGGNIKNLTQTPDLHELYPKVSPDGTKIAFLMDIGEGRAKIRSVWVMDIDGENRKKISDYARQPFWSPDSKVLGYLPQEYKKFDARSLANKGIKFYTLATGETRAHPNSDKISHLFNPGFSPDGKWIITTVHAGMGLNHGNLLIAADGEQIIDLHIKGCRPDFNPNGQSVAWGKTDHEIHIAPFIDSDDAPRVGEDFFVIKDSVNKIYHVEWAPDGKTLALSRGPTSKGDLSKPGTVIHAAEAVGVYATGWNLIVVKVPEDGGILDLQNPAENGKWVQITEDGASYKEPDWIPPKHEGLQCQRKKLFSAYSF